MHCSSQQMFEENCLYTDRHYKIIAFNWTCEIFAFHCDALFLATNVWGKLFIQIDITRSLHLIGLARSLPFIAMHCSSQQMFEQTVVPNFALGNFPEARRIRFNLPKTAQNHFSSSKIYWFITNYLWFCTNKILKERQWPHIFFSGKLSAWCGSSLLFWPCLGSGQM